MPTEKLFQQCRLTRGHAECTVWIPQNGAKLGAVVELLPERDKWHVAQVYDRTLPESELKHHQRLNRASLPSVEPTGQ